MTNETNAALSAALEALHAARPHIQNWLDRLEKDLPHSGMAWQSTGQDLDMVDSAIHAIMTLEASQREAPVAEGEWSQAGLTPQEMWDEIQAIRKLTDDDGTHGAPHVLVQQLLDRLAERPSVTNVSRDRIEEAYFSAKAGHRAGIDAVFALQLQSPALVSVEEIERVLLDICYADGPSPAWITYATAVHALQLPAPGKAATWREFMDQAPKFGQRQDSMLEQLSDLRLVANKLGFYDAADYLKGPLGEPRKAADEGIGKVLEILHYARENVEHIGDCERYIDAAIEQIRSPK